MTAITAIEKKSLKVGRYVDTAHVDTVIREYKQTRWIHNTERIGKYDSLSVWYSLEELEEFLQKSKEQGADGIRVYFGAYSENFTEKPVCAGRTTTVFVATKSKETEDGIINKDLYVQGETGTNILAYNIGAPNPPFGRSSDGDSDWGLGTTIIDRGEKGTIII